MSSKSGDRRRHTGAGHEADDLAAGGVASLMVAAPMILWTTAAEAAVGLTPLADFTVNTVPGQVAPAQYTITNNSSGPEAVGAVTVTDITLIPLLGVRWP